jgi:hypothetical protein
VPFDLVVDPWRKMVLDEIRQEPDQIVAAAFGGHARV